MKNACSECSTTTCPFSFTEEAEQYQNLGCLPSPFEIINMRTLFNKTWACHSDSSKPCVGAIKYLKEEGLPHKVIDKKLVTLDDDWSIYTRKQHVI